MRNISLNIILLASCSLAFGQLTPYSITVTASRPIVLPPVQAAINFTVTAALGTSLDQITAALQTSGITAAKLSGLNTQSLYDGKTYQQVQQWSFTVQVPIAQIQTNVAAVSNAQQALAKGTSVPPALSVNASPISPPVSAQLCPLPALIADAQAQAQKIAGAAGFGVGPILAVSSGTSAGATGPVAQPFAIAIVAASFAQFVAPPPPESCSIIVKFGLVSN